MFFQIIFHQARCKWFITLLLFLAMGTLVTLYVYLKNSTQFTNRAIQIIMKQMGHNLILLPESARPMDTYLCSDRQQLFSETVTEKLAQDTKLLSKYYVSMLQKKRTVNGEPVVLTGIRPVRRADESSEKGNMIQPVKQGCIRLGSDAARRFKTEKGALLTLFGRSRQVSDILPPRGSIDDCRIYLPLSECQEILGLPGKINCILAFECLHIGGSLERIEAYQRSRLAAVMPDFKQITRMDIARGRWLARMTTSRYLYYLLGLVFLITVVIIIITGLQEVTERRQEFGIMVSMGAGMPYIAGLYIVKLAVISLLASVVGFMTGSVLSVVLTSPFLVFNTRPVSIVWSQLPHVMLMTCLVAAAAEIVPLIKLMRFDPNEIINEG